MGEVCVNCGEDVRYVTNARGELYHILTGRRRCWGDRAEVAEVGSGSVSGRGLAESSDATDEVEWRALGEFPGYEVSSLGEVRRKSDGMRPSGVLRGKAIYYNLLDPGGNWRIRSGRTLVAGAFRQEINWRRKNS